MTAALILAAGSISDTVERGPTDALGSLSSIKRIIMIFRQAGIKKIVVITGHDADALEKHCAHMGAIFLRNDEYETGDMLSSVKVGLEYLRGKCSRVFVSPVKTPLFSARTVQSMAADDAPAVIPMYNNRTGHPLLISERLFERVLAYDGPGGVEGALAGDGLTRRFYEVSDEGILIDASSDIDVDGLVVKHSLRTIRPDARIRLSGEKSFFGPGTLQLLSLTDETGSLKRAAQHMGISYSKAIKMVIDIEEQLGFQVMISKQGGSRGGGSEITERGFALMRSYEAFVSDCEGLIDAAFEKHFGDVIGE